MDLKEKVKNLPITPGVYLMKDSAGQIIYVGKAKNLKNRVRSYFQHSKAHSKKTIKLVATLKDFDYILTDTEFEAFLLECQLIKDIKPFFNRKMKNPQNYSYIVMRMDELHPTLEVTNVCIENDGNLYFGPFISKFAVEKAVQGIKEFFKISCSNRSTVGSPCLNHSLGLCIGLCTGKVPREKYDSILTRIIALIKGDDLSPLAEMEEKMAAAAGQLDFELAAKYKGYLEAISFLHYKEGVVDFAEANQNIVTIEFLDDRTFKLFLIKGNTVLFSEKFSLEGTDVVITVRANILNFFKGVRDETPLNVHKEDLDEAQIIYSYLTGNHGRYALIPDALLTAQDHTLMDETILKLLTKP
ncbi:GIY-YIG nuclease family protein [Neobacillus sp. 114]|uniref:GIY-YIG nuclease family protein n=1 Tax=Neobacillus sp. 114 TaxID=3048535 RepID=UPI001C24C81E|nr:GIY-YIG nuclease family protein [Neobacillus sp. 114]MBU8918076.1 GIY-YIG nuclease family protein [Bacillus sp. FJAT-29953]